MVTIIIPVYNAFEDALNCIASVILHTPGDVPIVVVDDCSPSGNFLEFITPRFNQRVRVVRNEVNLGFPRTCNRAFFELGIEGDVILLNSDTVVTVRWVEKLRQAAFSRPDVGSVTPLTNNGTICSVPGFLENNSIPQNYSIDTFSELVEKLSLREYPELPTMVGHCLYLRRAPLDLARGFDVENFGFGYGEENDLSCRFRALGYVDILDDATFIFHKGQSSFGESSSERKRVNAQRLDEIHPDYLPRTLDFISHNPLHDLHARIWNVLSCRWSDTKPLTILHVLHNGPQNPVNHSIGGTELHVTDLISLNPEFAHWSIVPQIDRYLLTAHMSGNDRTIQLPRITPLEHIISPEYFDVVHFHHANGFDREELISAIRAHGRYWVSVHDYHLVCQHGMMMTPEMIRCNRHECVTTCGYPKSKTVRERELAKNLLTGAVATIIFSESSRNILKDVIPSLENFRIEPHGITDPGSSTRRIFASARDVLKPSSVNPLKLLCLGAVSPHKGLQALQFLAREKTIDSVPIEIHVLGEVVGGELDAIVHGKYRRETIAEKLESIGPHIGLILSVAPETYCLTFDELLRNDLPVIISNGGAPEERLAQSGAGWVISRVHARDIAREIKDILKNLLTHWDVYLAARRATSKIMLRPLPDEFSAYNSLYAAEKRRAVDGTRKLLSYFQPGVVPEV